MTELSILQLNIEGDNHFDTIPQLLEEKQPDVLCLQEVFESDLQHFHETYPHILYAPLISIEVENKFRLSVKGNLGNALCSKYPFQMSVKEYYVGEEENIPGYVNGEPNTLLRALCIADIQKNEEVFRIATTHFTWSKYGEVSELQKEHLKPLLQLIEKYRPFIFTGDFNAPRGKEIFDTIATHLKDNVPANITTSIDQHLHRISGIQLMVDGFFTSPEYSVTHIEMIDGVSDHQALFGKVQKL